MASMLAAQGFCPLVCAVSDTAHLRSRKVTARFSKGGFTGIVVRGIFRGPSAKMPSVISERKGDSGDGWILNNAGILRSMPLSVGFASVVAILLNRSFSGVAAVADASSALSRADVLVVCLSATVALTGLVWKSIEPKSQLPVALEGVNCMRMAPGLPDEVSQELNWTWEALAAVSTTVSLVVVYGNVCLFQAGLATESSEEGVCVAVNVDNLVQGSLFKTVSTSKKQMYLANLALYPSRSELPFLPPNTQAVIIQPLGDDGVMILGSDTLRGFGPSDQGWFVAIGEKLDSTLSDVISSDVDRNFPRSGQLEDASVQLPTR